MAETLSRTTAPTLITIAQSKTISKSLPAEVSASKMIS
jgi:hypothetical protein